LVKNFTNSKSKSYVVVQVMDDKKREEAVRNDGRL
jgi:hypothetical protein